MSLIAQNWIKQLWQLKHFYTPFALPVSADMTNLHRVDDTYICSKKSDGERCAILFCWHDDTNYVYKINRKNKITLLFEDRIINSHVPVDDESLFDGTLVDAEDMGHNSYIAFDCMAYEGFDMKNKPFIERIKVLNRICSNMIVNMAPKVWVEVDLIRDLEKDEHESDGIIFAKKYTAMARNQDRSMLKWKRRHTVDLLIEDNHAFANSPEGKPQKLSYRVTREYKKGIYECELGEGNQLVVLKERHDKSQPNQYSTIRRTLKSASLNPSYQELVCIIKSNQHS